MGNEYLVVENGFITCACNGEVNLTSTVKNYTIGGKKPLYLKDLLNAAVKCPRSSKQNPCTKVAAISTAGTETNVGANGETYLLRTTGFVTDKGRAVILKSPGQSQSKTSPIPSVENEVIKEEEPTEQALKEAIELIHKEKYALYFLRKSENLYQPLRPTRAFRKADETFVTKSDPLDIKDNIYVHTFAYLYVKQNNIIKEYKILSRGSLYNEQLGDIYFEDTNTNIKYPYIPIYEDGNIDISYSSFQLKDEADIKKLLKLSVNPKEPNQKDTLYFKDIEGVNKSDITDNDLETQKKFKPNKEGKQKRLNILCIIEDILGEIEDMYEKYYTNYKLAYAHNHSIIEDIKKTNEYSYTVANLVDIFYIDEKQKNEAQRLKEIYQSLVTFLLSDRDFINILIKEDNLANILNDKRFKIAKSYVQEISYLNKECLKDIIKYHVDKHSFVTTNNYIYTKSKRRMEDIKRLGFYRVLEFHGTNLEFTRTQEDPRELIAYLTFAIFFTNDYEKEIQKSSKYQEVDKLRKELYFLIKRITPLPNIGKENIRDIKKEINTQKDSYKKIILKEDCFLEEYSYLDIKHKIYSFFQKEKKVGLKSSFIYTNKEELFVDKGKKTPSEILDEISLKLQDAKLKELLKIYETINVNYDISYIVSCMNIVYLLTGSRIEISEESEKTNIFLDELNHIYEFMINLTNRRIELEDKEKDILLQEYEISNTYLNMIIKQLSYAYLDNQTLRKKAQSFLRKYEKKESRSYFVKLEDINDHLFDEEFKTKALIETITQTLGLINGFSSNTFDLLERVKDKDFDRTKTPSSLLKFYDTLIEQRNLFKATATLLSFITLGLYIFNKDKNFSNTMSAVTDLVNLVNATTKVILNEVKKTKNASDTQKILQVLAQNKDIQGISKTASNIATKVGIPLVVITGVYDSIKLYVEDDYDASAISAIKTTLSVYLLASVTIGSIIALIILEVLWYYFSHYVIDSDIEKYLVKSLLYKDIPFIEISYKKKSIWGNNYKAPYLFEQTNKIPNLKVISSDGFNHPKKLIEFIGSNYKGNEEYFNTALKNELSFFKSALFGYKLELLGRRRGKTLKNKFNYNVQLIQDTFVKIPSILYTDETSKFILEINQNYKLISKDNEIIPEENYYVFDLSNQNFTSLLELNTIKHKKASIMVISEQIELKYEFMYDYRELVYLDAINFNQVDFTPQDVENLKQFIEKKEEK